MNSCTKIWIPWLGQRDELSKEYTNCHVKIENPWLEERFSFKIKKWNILIIQFEFLDLKKGIHCGKHGKYMYSILDFWLEERTFFIKSWQRVVLIFEIIYLKKGLDWRKLW